MSKSENNLCDDEGTYEELQRENKKNVAKCAMRIFSFQFFASKMRNWCILISANCFHFLCCLHTPTEREGGRGRECKKETNIYPDFNRIHSLWFSFLYWMCVYKVISKEKNGVVSWENTSLLSLITLQATDNACKHFSFRTNVDVKQRNSKYPLIWHSDFFYFEQYFVSLINHFVRYGFYRWNSEGRYYINIIRFFRSETRNARCRRQCWEPHKIRKQNNKEHNFHFNKTDKAL